MPITDSQAQGERDRMLVPAAKEGSDVCEDKVTESNRETGALLGQQIPKEVQEEQQSKEENGQSKFRISGAQWPQNQSPKW